MKRFLRLSVYRGGKLVDDRYVPEKGELTVGSSAKNTVALLGSHLPSEHVLVHFDHKAPILHVVDGMSGRIALDGKTAQTLEELKARGQKQAEGWSIELPDTARGWVMMADAAFMFSLCPKPPPPPRKALPDMAKTGLMSGLATPIFGIMMVVGVFESAGVYAIHRMPSVEVDAPSQEDLDRFVEIIMPEKPKVEEKKPDEDAAKKAAEDAAKKRAEEEAKKKAEEEKKKAEDEKKQAENDADPEKAAKAAAEKKAQVRQAVAKKGLLSVIGATGGNGALANVFKQSSGIGGDIESALAGAGGVKLASGDEGPGRKGVEGGPGTTTIGDLSGAAGGGGGGNVQLAEKQKRVAPQISIDDSDVDVESGSVDKESLGKYIRMRIKSVQQCYEKELKRNPSLKGKIVVRFVINTQGRVSEVSIDQNTMGDENVAACIRALIQRWSFPVKPDEDAPVSFPFVFQPGG